MLVLIKGAGDIATGIAITLHRAGMDLVMTDLESPTSIRRTVCFSEAIRHKSTVVEGITAVLAVDIQAVRTAVQCEQIAVVVDPDANIRNELLPDAIIDAILAKENLGTSIGDAPIVIGVGPGFTAGVDCHAVIETQRGHDLGRIIIEGSATPNTGRPGDIGGYTVERVLRAPKAGIFSALRDIGTQVQAGETVAMVDDTLVQTQITGILRGILPDQTPVHQHMKCGDVDPRCKIAHCYSASDKARAIGGGVLTALLMLQRKNNR